MYTDDSQVIGAVLQGHKDRYQELIEKYKRMVYGIAWSHLGNVDLSEDAAQETFIKAYSYLGTLRNPSRFPGWLARIARNVCNSFGRQAKREAALQERWAIEATQPEDESRESLEEQLKESFASLPVIHREALTVFYIEDKSLRESAVILGISETALKARLFRARAALRVQLEQRLEDTLESLEPSKDFNRQVLALLPLSPKGLAGAGGLLALLGKLSAGLSFALWTGLLQSSITSGLMLWFFRAEAANIKDQPENEFRKAILKRNAVVVIVSMATVMLIVGLLQSRLDYHSILKVLAVYIMFAAWRTSRRLRVNTSPCMLGEVFGFVGMGLYSAAIGFLNAPIIVFPITMIVIMAMGFFTNKHRPARNDYNLFLRSATGGLGSVTLDEQPLELSQEQLKAFARFLGGQWLAADYYLQGDSIMLIVPEVRANFLSLLTKRLGSGSRVILSSDGTCNARVSLTDLRNIQQATHSNHTAEALESDVCRVVRYALQSFVREDLQSATSAVSAQMDDSIFKQDPGKTRHWRLQFVMCIIVMALLLAMDLWERHHQFPWKGH